MRADEIGETGPKADWPEPARALAPGLYFIATPIGAARDITLRALDILASADVLVAEDTRTLRHLMAIHAVRLGDRPVLAYHDHNGEAVRPHLLRLIGEGRSVAYASDAGTPLVADPGYQLARAVIDAGLLVISAPGPSAVLAALTVSGLPTDRFLFAGFAPPAAGARAKFLAELAVIPATVVLYESPKRISRMLREMAESFGADRLAAVCRELTKRFEEVSRGTLGTLAAQFADRAVKGEIVVLVDRRRGERVSVEMMEDALRRAMQEQSMKDAVSDVAAALGLPRRDVYRAALRLGAAR